MKSGQSLGKTVTNGENTMLGDVLWVARSGMSRTIDSTGSMAGSIADEDRVKKIPCSGPPCRASPVILPNIIRIRFKDRKITPLGV